ncbi:Appr-1-p processing protein, partial [Vibrio anguillarum]|nr:Appr-1-p processing protein [Vibrio anguillarum]
LNRYEQAKNTEQVIKGVHSWNARKQQFTPRQITIAEKVLDRQHWLSV